METPVLNDTRAPQLSPLPRTPFASASRLPPGRVALEPVIDGLVADGLLAQADAERARVGGRATRGLDAVHPLVLLANLKLPSAQRPGSELGLEALTEWLARASGRAYLRIDPTKIAVADVTDLVSHAYARRHRILPVDVTPTHARIATSEPLAVDWLPDIQRLLRREIELVVANPLDLHRYTMEFFGVTRSVRGAKDMRDGSTEAPSFEQLVELGRSGDVNADDHHIVHVVDWLLQYAYEQRASDIHLEPRRDIGRVRFRIDGVLHKVFEMPPPVMTAAVSRIKVLGRMDLAERRRPQDGRIKTRSPGGREVEMRLSTMPTAFGEKVVMRIFDPDTAFKPIEQLGFDAGEASAWNDLVQRPHGIVLVTGPTGSGKTTTLYAGLALLNDGSRNILTVEDPIEYAIDGIGQTQVNAKIELTFAKALRAILRQDPDVIMIGEMRDLETARIAIQSALTGHLVLSTLHTNNAAGGITRMLDMGVEDYLLTSTINGILAQRLVRRLEPTHRMAYAASPEEIERFELRRFQPEGEIVLYRPGPSAAAPTGYLGRTTIVEFLVMNDALRRAVMRHAGMGELEQLARESGMRTMYEDGILKALRGETTIEEVLRVTEDA